MDVARAGMAGLLLCLLMSYSAAAKEEVLCSGTVVPLTLSSGHSPYVRTRLGSHEGYFQIDTGSTISTVDAELFRRPVNSIVLLEDFEFPSFPRGSFTALKFRPIPGLKEGRQIGQVGADFLRLRSIEFHYEAAAPYLVISDQACSAEHLKAAGFIATAQKGYFGSDTNRLGGINRPVVFAHIGDVAVPAWIDTGFDEMGGGGAILVNDLVISKLRNTGIALTPMGSGQAINCHGERLETKLWRVADSALQITNEQNRPLFSYGRPVLAIFPRSSCGGPGNSKMPVVMLGAAYANWWGTLVVDGLNEQVWLSPTRTGVQSSAPVQQRPSGRRALVIAESDRGDVTITTAQTLELAKSNALDGCRKTGASCSISVSLAPSELGCVALARDWKTKKYALASGISLDDAKKMALERCGRIANAECMIQFSGCNE
jgi:Domain of unknown function (DUF4189)